MHCPNGYQGPCYQVVSDEFQTMRRFILPSNKVGQSGIIQSGNDNRNVQLTVIQNAASRRTNSNTQKDILQNGIGNMNFQSNIGQSMTNLPIMSKIPSLSSIPLLSNFNTPIMKNIPFISSFS